MASERFVLCKKKYMGAERAAGRRFLYAFYYNSFSLK